MRVPVVAVVMVALAAGGARADCNAESAAYHSEKSLLKADAYISCFELAAARTPTFPVISPTGMTSGGAATPTFGPVAPGNPNGMPIDEYLRQLKEQGGYSDYDWTQIMASSISTDGSMAVVYNKNAVAPQYAGEASFEITVTSPRSKLRQYFVEPGKFTDLSQYALGGGE